MRYRKSPASTIVHNNEPFNFNKSFNFDFNKLNLSNNNKVNDL